MTLALILAGIVAVAVIVLETWGRRQPLTPLVSRAALRHSLELLRSRGIDGSALVIRLPKSDFTLVVVKRVRTGVPPAFSVQTEVSSGLNRATHGRRIDSPEGRRRPVEENNSASLGRVLGEAESISELIALLDSAAHSLESRLFPGAKAQFRGPVLAFNIPDETGTET